MAEEMSLRAYACIISFLESKGWNFKRDDEKLRITTGFRTDDHDIDFIMYVDEDRKLVCFRSVLPGLFPEDKRIEGAVATCIANLGMFDGFFEYDLSDGEVVFKVSDSFRDGDMTVDVIEYMFRMCYAFVDRYNDRFFDLARGRMTLQEFKDLEG